MGQHSEKCLLLIIGATSCLATELYVYFVGSGLFKDLLLEFWFPVMLLSACVIFSIFRFGGRFPLVMILIFALSLHLIQFVRPPAGFAWNPDAPYVLQLIEHTLDTGHWTFGYGVEKTAVYSNYPLMYIFLSSLSMLASIPSMVLLKYAMAVVNLLTLVTLYVLTGALFNSDRLRNLSVFIFSLDPYYHAIDSYPHAESYAIIFFPLVLYYVLRSADPRRSKTGLAILLLLLIVVTMSHHFTSYITALSLVVGSVALYAASRRRVIPYVLPTFSVMLVFGWLLFTAYQTMSSHIGAIEAVINNLRLSLRFVAYFEQGAGLFYASKYLEQLTLVRNAVLLMFVIVGLAYSILGNLDNHSHLPKSIWAKFKSFPRQKQNHAVFVVLLLFYGILSAISLFGVGWRETWATDLRTRILEFAFFPIAVFAAVGITTLGKMRWRGSKGPRLRTGVIVVMGLLLLVTFVPSTVVQAFPRYYYEAGSPIPFEDLPPVAPEHQYSLGIWIRYHVDPSRYVFAGSMDGPRETSTYILGYGYQTRWSDRLFDATLVPSSTDEVIYVVNSYNVAIPDRYGRTLDNSTLQFVTDHFSRIYDNGVTDLNAAFSETAE